MIKSLYYLIRCRIGKPAVYRYYPQDAVGWYIAKCRSCDGQLELHD